MWRDGWREGNGRQIYYINRCISRPLKGKLYRGEFVLIISAWRRLFLFFLPIVSAPSCSLPVLIIAFFSHFFFYPLVFLPQLSLAFSFSTEVLCCAAKAVSSSEHALERLFMDSSMKPYYICVRAWVCVCVCVCVRERERGRERRRKIKRGKGIPGAGLQYHLYANLFRLW